MKSLKITTIMLIILFLCFTVSIQAQTLNNILKKLNNIETLQKQDIQNLQEHLSESQSEDNLSELSELKSSIEVLRSMIDSLYSEVEKINKTVIDGTADDSKDSELINSIIPDLNQLISELREIIENTPAQETEEDETETDDDEEESEESPIEFSGFFDVHADRLELSDNIFGLGPFELDLESPFSEYISGSAAVVFEDGVSEVGVGFVDIHFFEAGRGSSSPRGRIFTDPGYHLQIGQFDIPFGVEYLFYATPDRKSISAPLLTELVFDGGWTDLGARAFWSYPSYNATVYFVNGFETGYATGGRLGIRPFENPLSSHSIRDEPIFEIGLSGVYDLDKNSNKEFLIYGSDIEINFSNASFIAEYAFREHTLLNYNQHTFYSQASYNTERLNLQLLGRYEEYQEDYKENTNEPVISRITAGISKEFYGVSILKLEYQYFPILNDKLNEDYEVSVDDHVISTQLAIMF